MNTDKPSVRLVVDLFGIVQAVGFRPTLHQLATRARLGGWVQNRADRVRLSIDGPEEKLNKFLDDLPNGIPELARLDRMEILSRSSLASNEIEQTFQIIDSVAGSQAEVAIPADLAMCHECHQEILSPTNRRYGYPFTTCTRCGPRYTVINSMPYDRERTTLSEFPLCDACRAEYENPSDRRFHAESTACPRCGPQLVFEENDQSCSGRDALRKARQRLSQGAVVAVRGIGGFLLAVDAGNRRAIAVLRERKRRPDKPFAVMAADITSLSRVCTVSETAKDLLTSPQMPIVILDLNDNASTVLPVDLLTPDAQTLGVMLPTSPLHQLLLTPLEDDPVPPFEFLIMTSGNRGGEPICISNEEARDRLQDIADAMVCHDREINLRNDDSLCVIRGKSPQVWRRARGYAPEPIHLKYPLNRRVLAMGAELRNAIAIGRNRQVVMSPHVGDLDSPEALDSLRLVTDCLPKFLDCEPECIAVDLHPDMHATALGRELATRWDIPLFEVQHHHAHAVACMAEHGCDEALALIFDGTGLGTDGNIWGAEVLHVVADGFQRKATFVPVPMPGGDAAVLQPARQLIGRWIAAGVKDMSGITDRLQVTEQEIDVWSRQIECNINSPLSHSAGRLFDSFSVALGMAPARITYDGQPAIRLESLARRYRKTKDVPTIPFTAIEKENFLSVDWSDAFLKLRDCQVSPGDRAAWAMAVHMTIANAAIKMIEFATSCSTCRTVVLSGGVFMNRILADLLTSQLRGMGLNVLEHAVVPPNDGGISLGQAVIVGR